jgi:uncharacterized protein YcfJ
MLKLINYKRCTLGALVALAFPVWSQEQARVISTTPVYQQVTENQQICGTSQAVVTQPNSGAGSAMGAIAGGVVGNSMGRGSGNAAATAIGIMGGAILGDRIEGQNVSVQNVQTCHLQPIQKTKLAYYDVKYEYAGKQYAVQMPNDPGQFINISITPQVVGNQNYAPSQNAQSVQTMPQAVLVAPAPVYVGPPVNPYGYPYSYGPSPFSVHLGLGYYGGYHRR